MGLISTYFKLTLKVIGLQKLPFIWQLKAANAILNNLRQLLSLKQYFLKIYRRTTQPLVLCKLFLINLKTKTITHIFCLFWHLKPTSANPLWLFRLRKYVFAYLPFNWAIHSARLLKDAQSIVWQHVCKKRIKLTYPTYLEHDSILIATQLYTNVQFM